MRRRTCDIMLDAPAAAAAAAAWLTSAQ